MTTRELIQTYGHDGEHPHFSREDWKHEVMNNETDLGYWRWVAENINEANRVFDELASKIW